MNSKTVLGILITLIVAGGAYWFYTDYKKEPANRLANGSTMNDPNTVGATDTTRDPRMNGTWKSTEDAKFTREFRADGTVTDRYEGDSSATEEGEWTVVDPTREVTDIPIAYLDGTTVIKINFQKAGVMYFGVQNLTETNLSLVNISGRGNILEFTKVQ